MPDPVIDPADADLEPETPTPPAAPPARSAKATAASAPPAKPREMPETLEDAQAELERTRTALAKANREATDRRKRVEEFEAAEEEKKNAQLTEAEKARKQSEVQAKKLTDAEADRDALRAELLQVRIAHAVEREATAAGFQYPEIVASLIEADRIEVDPDTGKFTGVKEAVNRVAKDRPGLLSAPRGGGTPARTGPTPRPGQPNGKPAGQQQQPPELTDELRQSGRYAY